MNAERRSDEAININEEIEIALLSSFAFVLHS